MIAKTLCGEPAAAQNKRWITAWTASVQGPYPSGFALLQPDLSLVFPDPARGAADQSFRMIVRPDLWGDQARIRLSNVFGTKPVRFDQIMSAYSLRVRPSLPAQAAPSPSAARRGSRSRPAKTPGATRCLTVRA